MSKFIQCLLDCARPAAEQKQIRFNHADLALQAFRLYHTAAEQMRYQRTGFTQDYKTTQQMIVAGIASHMTSELAKVNLMKRQQYLAIQQAIAHWNPSTSTNEHARECQFVKQALLSCLPAARQRQQLRELCKDYKYHLAEDIETQLIHDHPQLYQLYQAPTATLANNANKSQSTTPTVKVIQPARSLNRFITPVCNPTLYLKCVKKSSRQVRGRSCIGKNHSIRPISNPASTRFSTGTPAAKTRT